MPTIIARTEPANIGLLDSKLVKEHFYRLFFAKFMGFVKESKKSGEFKIPKSPIVVHRDFAKKGMDSILVPMLRNLTQSEFYGDSQIENNLEKQSIYYHKTYINQRRTGVETPGRMGNQLVKTIDLVKNASPQIEEKLPRHTEVHICRSFYEGFSGNITAATSQDGLGITKRYHPNIYCAGVGGVTWSGTSATHITNIHNSVQSVLAGADTNKMTAKTLRRFNNYCVKKKIPPILMGGLEVRPLLVSANQASQLFEDPEFYNAQLQANVRDAKKNPIFSGMLGMYHGFILFERTFSVFGVSTTSSTVTWGASNPLSALDSYAAAGAITFGPSAISSGWAFGPHYTTRDYDHGNRAEVASAIIDGFARADLYDDPDSPTSAINESSAVLVTYSPELAA